MTTSKPTPTSQQERVTAVWNALAAQGWTPEQIVEVIIDMIEHDAGGISYTTGDMIDALRH